MRTCWASARSPLPGRCSAWPRCATRAWWPSTAGQPRCLRSNEHEVSVVCGPGAKWVVVRRAKLLHLPSIEQSRVPSEALPAALPRHRTRRAAQSNVSSNGRTLIVTRGCLPIPNFCTTGFYRGPLSRRPY